MKNLLLAGALTAGLSAFTVSALPLNITVDTAGNLLNGAGVATGSQYDTILGVNGNPNNPSDNLKFLNHEIGNWNGVPLSPTLTPATLTGVLDLGDSSDFTTSGSTFTVKPPSAGGYDYVVFHFGAGRAGGGQVSPGGWWEAIYLGGLDISSLTFTIPTVGNDPVGGISSGRFFGPTSQVPDGGATLALLAVGVAMLGTFKRKLSPQ